MKRLLIALVLIVLLSTSATASEADLFCRNASGTFVPCTGGPTGTPLPTSGIDSGPQSASATPANSSHAAGTSVGGLFTIAIARIAGGSGGLTNLAYKSTGGSTGAIVLRIWDKNPSNTTCTDNTAFAGSDTDDANLVLTPTTLSPAAPGVTTGDAATYAQLYGFYIDYANADSPTTKNVYACVVTVTTDTADQNKLVRLTLSGPQN